MRNLAAVLTFACLIPAAHGQAISAGILGGVSLTSGFPNETRITFASTPLYSTYSSRAGNYMVGGFVELRLAWHFAVEAEGIYRPLNFRASTSSVQQTSSPDNTVLSWTFPVLLKRRFPRTAIGGHLTPIVEAGPAFRVSGNRNDTSLSVFGATAGLGAEAKLGRASLTPRFRYTRWAADSVAAPFIPESNPNQVEFLVGFSF